MRDGIRLLAVILGSSVALTGCDSSYSPTDAGQGGSGTSYSATQARKTLKERDDVQIVSATGNVTPALQQYRDLFGGGDPNPNSAGDFGSGRREINWDGVPASFTNNDAFPGNFFNVTSKRGVVFTTDGFAFRISNQGYNDLNSAYGEEFQPFSPFKMFVARGSTVIDVHFFVAGSEDAAVVDGFGSVFEDVGRAHSTTIEYFDVDGNKLLEVAAPRSSDAHGQSFVGAKFASAIVARVRITAGDTPLSETTFDNVKGAGKKFDLVATDDFIYGEPHKIK